MKRFSAALALASMVMTVAAQAAAPLADLSQIHGKVLVNHGKGFEAVVGAVSLNAGDQVMVGSESGAVISYVSGCSVSVVKPKVITIGAKAPCVAGVATIEAENTFIVPVADFDPVAVPPVFPLLPLLVGGAAVAGGAIYFATRDNNDPVSATENF
jgi:hypothetical protein